MVTKMDSDFQDYFSISNIIQTSYTQNRCSTIEVMLLHTHAMQDDFANTDFLGSFGSHVKEMKIDKRRGKV